MNCLLDYSSQTDKPNQVSILKIWFKWWDYYIINLYDYNTVKQLIPES